MTARLNFSYLHSEKIGYGVHGIATHKGLTNIGVDVYDGLADSADLELENKRAGICKDILFLTLASHVNGWWKGQRAHLFTMYESTEIPESFRETLHNFETVLVPSQACLEMFSRYHDNVKYVPLGVDGERWHYQKRNTDDVFFNFMIAGSGVRKGNDLAHKAFLKVFGNHKPSVDKPIPRLIMKSPKNEKYEGNNVQVVGGYMPPEDEVALYASAHCYLQPSRGEGWGMQPLQALAQGIPTILTNAHGHVPFAKYGITLSSELVPATYMDIFGNSGEWWEPNFDELCASISEVYENYDEHAARAATNSPLVINEFTWEKSAQAIVEALGGEERLSEPIELPTQKIWFQPDIRRYRVVTLRDWKADIGGTTYFFAKGKEYYELADVKRVMFEAGVLDPICATPDEGLSSKQLERLEEYSAKFDKCPTCGHKVGIEDDDAICI